VASLTHQVDDSPVFLPLLKMIQRSVAQNDNSIECQARFRTIPIHEFIDCVTISPLRILRSEVVQDCGFGVFEIKQA
jgi:hypothetical protein